MLMYNSHSIYMYFLVNTLYNFIRVVPSLLDCCDVGHDMNSQQKVALKVKLISVLMFFTCFVFLREIEDNI